MVMHKNVVFFIFLMYICNVLKIYFMVKETDSIKIQKLADYVVSDGYNINSREFNTLVSILLPKVKSYIYSIASSHSESYIEELTSDTFESMCKYINSYNNEHKFITWTYTIAKNLVNKTYKYSLNDVVDLTLDKDFHIEKPEYDYMYIRDDQSSLISLSNYIIDENNNNEEREEAIGELYKVLMNFDDSVDKSIFIHKEINNVLEKDLAKHYDISINTVKSKSKYFKKKLATKINDKHKHILNVFNIKQKI